MKPARDNEAILTKRPVKSIQVSRVRTDDPSGVSHRDWIRPSHNTLFPTIYLVIYSFIYLLFILFVFLISGDIRMLPLKKYQFIFQMNIKRELNNQVIAQ